MHRIEARNALRNAAARGEITESDLRSAFRQIDADLRHGFLVHVTVDWTDVFHQADDFSAKYADSDGQRTIDLLHVALAVECGAETFLSFDKRQRKLAKVVGLNVKP